MTSTLERWFQLRAHGTKVGTEVRAGLTTFMVMAYIIFVNPIILGYVGVPGLDGKGLPFASDADRDLSHRRPALHRHGGLHATTRSRWPPAWGSTRSSPSSWSPAAGSRGPRR